MKLKLLLIALLLLVAANASGQFYTRIGSASEDFTCGVTKVGTDLVECKAVPASTSQRYHITQIITQSTTATANQYSVQSGTGTACATGTTAVFPADAVTTKYVGPTNAQAPHIISFFPTPLHITAGHAICVLGIATQLTTMQISGYVQ